MDRGTQVSLWYLRLFVEIDCLNQQLLSHLRRLIEFSYIAGLLYLPFHSDLPYRLMYLIQLSTTRGIG